MVRGQSFWFNDLSLIDCQLQTTAEFTESLDEDGLTTAPFKPLSD